MRLRTCVLKGAINLCFSQAKYESKKKSLLHYVEITRNVDLVAREARPQAVCRSYGHDFRLGGTTSLCSCEVPRVLFLGVCLDFYYCLRRVLVPKFGFHFSWRAVAQALVKPRLVPP